jgi:hypothetical protein
MIGERIIKGITYFTLAGLINAHAITSAKGDEGKQPQRIVYKQQVYEFSNNRTTNDRVIFGAMVVGDERYDLICETEYDALGAQSTTCYIDGGSYGPLDGRLVPDAKYHGRLVEPTMEDIVVDCLEEHEFADWCVPFEEISPEEQAKDTAAYTTLVRKLFERRENRRHEKPVASAAMYK